MEGTPNREQRRLSLSARKARSCLRTILDGKTNNPVPYLTSHDCGCSKGCIPQAPFRSAGAATCPGPSDASIEGRFLALVWLSDRHG